MRAIALLRRYAAAIWLFTLVLIGLGLGSAWVMPSGIYPEVEFPRIVVVAKVGDATPDVYLTTVTRPLEQALTTVLGIERIRSKTIRGATEISLQFSSGTDMWRALQVVQASVAEARSELPAGTEITVEKITTGSFPVITFNLSGPVDPRELREAQGRGGEDRGHEAREGHPVAAGEGHRDEVRGDGEEQHAAEAVEPAPGEGGEQGDGAGEEEAGQRVLCTELGVGGLGQHRERDGAAEDQRARQRHREGRERAEREAREEATFEHDGSAR